MLVIKLLSPFQIGFIIIFHVGICSNRSVLYFQGKFVMQGSYQELANSDDLYAQLLTEEQEQTDEEKVNAFNVAKTMRQQSVRVSYLTC